MPTVHRTGECARHSSTHARESATSVAIVIISRTPASVARARTVTRHADESWRGERGRISRRQLEAALPDEDAYCFVCGPESLVHEVPRLLRELGVAPERIRVEEWSSR